jgi:integrase
MAIYKRGRIWWIDYYDPGKNRVQESSCSSNRRDAEKLLSLRQADIMRGQYQLPCKITLDQFGRKYIEYAKVNKRSWGRDVPMLDHFQAFFGNRLLSEIAPADVEEYKNYRCTLVKKSTVNRELTLMKRLFNLASVWDLFNGKNPVCRVRFFREDNIKLRTLSSDEERRLLSNAAPYLQDLICFALHTGMRVGEIFSLSWRDIDFAQGIISVRAQKTDTIRKIPINNVTRRILDFWSLGRRSEFVFYNPDTGKPFCDLKAGFKLACKKAGISDVTWHTLRHTFASRLVARGVDIVTVQELLGHSTVTMTMRYAHTNLQAKQAAVRKLAPCSNNLLTMPQKARFNLQNVTAEV